MMDIKRSGTVTTLECAVALNHPNADEFRQLSNQCFGHGIPRIVVDMRQTPLIDSAGLEALLDVKDHCEQLGGSMVIARPNALCADILRINGLNHEISIYNDYVPAVGSFSK